jgi:uncharacterized membrane protein
MTTNERFSIAQALRYGWQSFTARVPFFLGLIVVALLVTLGPNQMIHQLFPDGGAGFVIAQLVVQIMSFIMGMIACRLALDIYDTGAPDLSKLGELLPLTPRYVLVQFLYMLLVIVGLVFLVVPGLVVFCMFFCAGPLIVDRDCGVFEAFGMSKNVSDGARWQLFLFFLTLLLLNLAGLLMFFVGLLVTLPVSLMATYYVYRQLSPAPAAVSAG